MEGPKWGWRARTSLLLVLVVTATGANGRYTVQKAMNQCAGYCKGTSKFNFEPGSIYHYDYEVDVSSAIDGARGPGDTPSQMMIRAKADLAALDSPCDLTLTLHNVRFVDPETGHFSTYGEDFSATLEKLPLRFSLQHGKVEELCSLPEEKTWALNFKRGLLSSIQNSMDDLKVSQTVYETDIAGSCETRYTAFSDLWWEQELWGGGGRGRRVKGATPTTTIRRTKDLSSCSERTSYFLSLQANPTGRSKARHMLRSTHECEQSVSEKPDDEIGRYSSSSEEDEEGEEFADAKVGGILLRSECREKHLFEPFSYRGSGATTNVTTRLILRTKETAASSKNKANQALARGLSNKGVIVPYTYSTLLYDHSADSFVGTPSEQVGGGDAVKDVVAALEAVESATANGVTADAPTSFAALIAALRRLSHGEVMALFKVAATGRSRKFLLDAMPVVATAASMSAFRDLYRSGDVTEAEMESWMGGIAFLKRPTPPMIAAVAPLLKGNPEPNTVLGVTALVHSYCRYGGGDNAATATDDAHTGSSSSSEESEHSSSEEEVPALGAACGDKAEVREVIERLEEMLGKEGCNFYREERRVVAEVRILEAYLALKGLANAGVAPSPKAMDSISRCYKDPENPIDLRLAAIDVLRRMPCDAATTLRVQLLDTYANVSAGPKETEVRIAAYMTTMQCASLEVIKRVEDTLDREEANQVGSFVWTHLTNLRSNPSTSSEAYSVPLSDLLASKNLRRKFRSDVRRFSRHYRISTGDAVEPAGSRDWHSAFEGGGISALGAGADAEASVILSPESYIPRSGSLNLTVRLFGAEVDLLDVGARAEGLEPLVESIFGPASNADDGVVSRISKVKKDEDPAEGTARRITDALFHTRSKNRPSEPRGSGYVRVFGNELFYGRFRGLGEMMASVTSKMRTVHAATGRMRGMLSDPVAQLAAALAQQREIEFSRSIAFLDAALVMPTAAGLPLSLVANGTASVALSLRGRVDITGRAEGNFEAEGVLAPSAALMVTGTMSVAASEASRSGLRLDASLRTNTRAEGKLRYRKGKLAEASFTAPRDAGEEVFAVKSELFALGRRAGEARPLTGRRQGREEAESCTPKAVSKAIGCEMCARASYPNATGDNSSPRFPLTGPGLVSVMLRKTDTFDRYEIKYEFTDEAREEERSEGRGPMTDDEYLEEMRTGGKRFKRVRNLLLYFDTPGSLVNRKIRGALMIEGGVGGASLVQASVETPWTRTLEVVAGLENTASARGVGLTATLGGEEVVTAQAELRSVLRRPGSDGVGAPVTPSGRYEPSVTVSFRGRTLIDLHGRVDYVHGSKYSGDLLLAGDLIREPVTISGDLTSDGGRYDLTGSVKSSLIEGTLQGNFKRTVGGQKKKGVTETDKDAGKFVNAKATFKYSLRGEKEHIFDVSARYLRNAKGALAKDSAYLTVLSTQFPAYEIDATWDSSVSEGPYFEGRGRLTIGKDGPRWETRPLLVLRGRDHLAFRFFLACRAKKLHYDISLKHQITEKALMQHAILRMGTNHEFSAVLNATSRSHPSTRYAVESEIRLPRTLQVGQKSHSPGQRVFAVRAALDEVRRRTYELSAGTEWWWSSITGAAVASGTYSNRGNRTNSDRRVDGKLWVVHGREQIDKASEEPSLDFSLRLTQADWRASVMASTERPRKYKMEAHYAKTGLGEHTVTGWAELSMGRKYDGKAVITDGFSTKSLYLELGLGRRMSLDTKLHLGEELNGLEVDLFWDKAKNMRLFTGATVEFLGVSSKPRLRNNGDKVPDNADHGLHGSVWLEYPGRKIRGEGLMMQDETTADLSWAPDKQISAALLTERKEGGARLNLSLQTPFQGIERQSASAVYTWDGKKFHGLLDASWRKEVENLAAELTMVLPKDGASPWESTADMELQVKSTMSSIRDARFSVLHRASPAPLGTNTTARIAWNGAESFFTNVAWTLEETERDMVLSGSALLRSTGPNLRHFGTHFTFGRRGDRDVDMTGSLSWRRPYDIKETAVDLGFSLSGLSYGRGYFNLSRAIGEHENASATFSYSSGGSGGHSVISSELYLDGERSAVASVSGIVTEDGVANVDARLEAPWFSAVEATLRHNFRNGEGMHDQVVINYGGQTVAEADIEAALFSQNDFVVRISGGVSGTVAATKLEHKLTPISIRSIVEITFNGETSSLLLESRDEEGTAPRNQNWRPRVIHGSITATSPRLRAGRLRFVMDFARTGKGNFETAVAAPGISGRHSLNVKDILNWESRLECYRGWEGHVLLNVVNVTMINEFDGNSFKHFSYTYMRGLEHAMTFDLNLAWGGKDHPPDMALIGDITFILPWSHPLALHLEIPRSKTTETGITVLEPKITVTYGEEQKNLTIISRMERGGPLTRISSEVVMNDCKTMSFGIRYNLAAEEKTIHVFASMDNNEQSEATLTFHFPSQLGASAFLTISPAGVQESTVLSLDFDLLGSEKRFKLMMGTEKNKNILHSKLDVVGKIKFEGWKYSATAIIEAPIRRSFAIEIDLENPNKMVNLKVTKNGKDYLILTGSAGISNDSARLTLDLKSEMEGMEKVSFIAAYDKINGDHHVEAMLDRDAIKSQITGKLHTDETLTEIQALIRLPIVGYEHMKAETTFDISPGSPSFNIEFQRTTLVYRITGAAQSGTGFLNTSLNLRTPFQGYEKMDATSSYFVDSKLRKTELRLLLNFNGAESSIVGAMASPISSSMHGNLVVLTPLRGFEKIDVSFYYDISKRGQLDAKAHLITMGGTSSIIFSGKIEERVNIYEGRLLISSPYLPGSIGTFGLEAEYQIKRKVELRINIGNQIPAYTASITANEKGSTTVVTTPIEGYRRLTLTLEKDLINKTSASLLLTKEDDRYSVSGKIENWRNHSGNVFVEVKTAIAGWEDISIQASYDFPPGKEMKAGFEAQRNGMSTFVSGRITGRLSRKAGRASATARWNFATPNPSEFSVNGIYDIAASDKSLEINIESPFQGYERLEAKARVERENAFAMFTMPSVSYLIKGKREGDKGGNIIINKNRAAILYASASLNRGREVKFNAEVASLIPGYDGNLNTSVQYNRPIGRGFSLIANGMLTVEGFGMEKITSMDMAVSTNKPEGGSMVKIDVSTPLVSALETLYLYLDYNGKGTLEGRVRTVFEGFEDLEGTAEWSANDIYTMAVTARRGDEMYVSHNELEKVPGLFRVTTNLTTPIEGFEELGSVTRFFYEEENESTWNLEVEIKTLLYDEVMLGVEGYLHTKERAAETEIILNTINPGYETIISKFSYDLVGYSSEGKYIKANSEAEGRSFFVGSGVHKEGVSRIKLSAPTISPDEFDGVVVFNEWRNSETRVRVGKLEGNIFIDIPSNGNGNIKFVSNLKGYELIEAKWKLEEVENAASILEASATLGTDKMIQFELKNNLDVSNLESKTSIVLPGGKRYDATARWEVIPNSREFFGRVDMSWAELGKVLEAEINAKAPKGTFSAKTRAVSSQWRDGKEVTLSVGLEYEDIGARAESSLRWGDGENETVVLKGKLEIAALKVISNLEFTTPFTQPLLFSLDYDFSAESPKLLVASYQYGKSSYSFKGEITNNEFDFEMTTPILKYQVLKIKGSRILNRLHKEASLMYELGEEAKGEFNASVKSAPNQPYEVTFFSEAYGSYKWSIVGRASMINSMHVSGNLDLKWGSDGNVKFQMEWLPPEKVSVEINLSGWRSPLLISWSLRRMEKQDKRINLEVILQTGISVKKRISFIVAITPTDHGKTNFEVNLDTSGEDEKWSVRGTVARSNGESYAMEATLLRGGVTLANVEGKMQHQPGSYTQISLRGGSAVFESGYDIRGNSKEAHILAVYGESHKIDAKARGTLESDATKASLTVETNFVGFSKLNIEAELGGSVDDRDATFRAEWDDGRLEVRANGAFVEETGFAKGRFTVRTPWSPIEEIEMEAMAKTKGPRYEINATTKAAMDYSASFDVTVDLDHYEGDINAVISGGKIDLPARFHASAVLRPKELLKIRIETPFMVTVDVSSRRVEDAYDVISDAVWGEGQKLKLKGKIRSQPEDYGLIGELELNGRRMAINAFTKGGCLSSDNCNVESGFSLSTPYPQFSHMSMFFSLMKDSSNQLIGGLNMTTPFRALPTLTATLSMKVENGKGLKGELTATTDKGHIRFGMQIHKDLLGYNAVNFDLHLPFLANSSPVKFECNLQNNRRDWRSAAVDIQLSLSNVTYRAGLAYVFVNYVINGSFNFITPHRNYSGGLRGHYGNNSMTAAGYFKENTLQLFLHLDKLAKEIKGNFSLAAPGLNIPDVELTLRANFLKDIVFYSTYKFGTTTGLIDIAFSGKGIIASLLVPPMFDSQISFKFILNKENMKYDVDSGLSFDKSKHSLQLSIEMYENIIINGMLLSTSWGDRDIDIYLRKDKKIGRAKVSGYVGASWDASKQSIVTFSLMWKGIEHKGKFDLKTVGRYAVSVDLSSPWLPTGTVNISAFYINDIDALKTEFKYENKNGMNSVRFEMGENEGRKTIKGKIIKYSNTLAETDASLFLREGLLEGAAWLKYKNSSHKASILLKAFPITIELELDSEFLRKTSSNPISVNAKVDTDAMKCHLCVKTPYEIMESANLTALAKFVNNGHLVMETAISVKGNFLGYQKHRIAAVTIKLPYPYAPNSPIQQYMFELNISPGRNKFMGAFDYELRKSYGHVNTHVQLSLDSSSNSNPKFYEIKAYGKVNKDDSSAEASGLIVWAGKKHGEVEIEFGTNKFEDGFVLSSQIIISDKEKYQGFMDIGQQLGKVELIWPEKKTITIDFEREIEGWDAFRIGLAMKTPYDMLSDVSLKAKSVFTDDGYVGEFNARKENQSIAIKIDGTFENEAPNIVLKGGVSVHVNGARWGEISGHGRFLCDGVSLGLDLKSELPELRDVHFLGGADWSIQRSKGPSIKLQVSYNDQEFIDMTADTSYKSLSGGAYLRTLWTLPASLRYEFEMQTIKEMAGIARICYGHCVGINFTLNGTKEITARMELPTRVLGMDWALKSEENELHCSSRLIWHKEHSLGFNFDLQSQDHINMLVEVDLPVRSFRLVAKNGYIENSNASYSYVKFYWDAARDPLKVISVGIAIDKDKEQGNTDAVVTITHPALRRDIVLRVSCSPLHLPFWGRLELEYSPNEADLFVARVKLDELKLVAGRAKTMSLLVSMRHQSSGLDVRVGAQGATGMDKAGGQLVAKYVDTRGRERTIVLTAKAHRERRRLQLKADTNENSLSVTAELENIGLRLETKVNRKPPLTLRLLVDRDMPSALFEADHGRRRYKVYFGSTEKVGSGPIKSVTARLSRRDVDDDAPPSTIAVAPSVETVLSGTTVSLNTSRVLSTRFLWEQRGGLRTPDVPATLTAATGTVGGWIREAYSDVGHAWAAVAGEAAAGFLGEGTTHKLRFWYLSIEDEVEGFSTYSRNEVNALVEDFRSLEEMLSYMYSRNDFFIQDIDRFLVSAMEKVNVATSCVSAFFKDAVVQAYVTIRKAASAILSSASRLVGDAIEATGSAVSSALPDPAEAARRLGEAAGRVAATARRVGAAVRGAARRLAHWAEGVVEEANLWVEVRWTRAKQAVWDWAAAEAERIRPAMLVFHSYVIRFKEIVEEVQNMADDISISIAENLANVREIIELGELVDYYTFKVRHLDLKQTTDKIKAYFNRTWETIKEDFRNGLGEYRDVVMQKYRELAGRYDQFMQLPPIVEFTGTVNFLYRKTIWTWHYLELGDYFKRVVTDFVIDLARAVADLASQIAEASRDPNSGSGGSRDVTVDTHIRGTDRSYVLEAGYFEYNIKLPFDWDSFDSVPHFRQMWESPKESRRTQSSEDLSSGPNRPGSTAFTRIRTVLADALLDASSAAALTEATDGEMTAAAALAALALPPFPASALVAGDSHLVTFDGRDYSFSATRCSYLLAGDFDGGSFSLVANYDDKGHRRSVSVFVPVETQSTPTKGRRRTRDVKVKERRIDVAADGRVSVDGRRVELPIEIESATVGRDGERVVVEVGRPAPGSFPRMAPTLDTLHSSSASMVLDCNPFHNVCTVRISGWFFARTAGLLGTYNNEPSDDLESPDGRVLSKGQVKEFAESWRVGNCSGEGGAVGTYPISPPKSSPSPLPTATEPCTVFFDRESDILSPLQPCFSRVDPAPYGRLCEVNVAAAPNSPSGWETAACASAAAYVAQCRNAGMDLWVPQSCVRCYLSDGSVLSAGETKVYGGEGGEDSTTPAPQSGDVVFLVEQRPCLRGTQISNLAVKLDTAMRTRGLRDNRFALVGFNGGYSSTGRNKAASGVAMASRVFGGPHTHTVDGKIWSNKRHFEKAFHNMLFDGREGNGPGGRTTPMEALWYAARLPFRDGVSKTVVLVMCGDCRDATDAAYADAVGMLVEGDLTLHVLAPTNLRTSRQPSTGPPAAVGFDSVGAFTTRNVRSLAPSRDLLRQLVKPKDLCSPLALETNGTRFDVGSVLGGPPTPTSMPPPEGQPSEKESHAEEMRRKRQQKFALDVFVRRVALTASPSSCQKCDCVADREGVGRVACQRCLFSSMEQFFKEWDSLIYEDDQGDEPESD